MLTSSVSRSRTRQRNYEQRDSRSRMPLRQLDKQLFKLQKKNVFDVKPK